MVFPKQLIKELEFKARSPAFRTLAFNQNASYICVWRVSTVPHAMMSRRPLYSGPSSRQDTGSVFLCFAVDVLYRWNSVVFSQDEANQVGTFPRREPRR